MKNSILNLLHNYKIYSRKFFKVPFLLGKSILHRSLFKNNRYATILLLFFVITLVLPSCLPYFPKMKVKKIMQIPIGTNANMIQVLKKGEHNFSLPVFYYVKNNKFYVNDYYNHSLKVFNMKGTLKKSMKPQSFQNLWNPFFFIIDNNGNYYIENQSVSNYSGDASYYSDILKFDSKGLFIKKVCTVPGALKKMSVNQYNYLTLIFQGLTNDWHVQRYINDRLIGDHIFFTNFLVETILLDNDNLLLFEDDSEKVSTFYEYNILTHKLQESFFRMPLSEKILLGIDENKNMYFAKNYNTKYIVIEKKEFESSEKIKRLCSVSQRNKFGIFVDLFISDSGQVFQLRMNENKFSVVEYDF